MKKEGEDFMEHLLVDSQLVITIQLVQKKVNQCFLAFFFLKKHNFICNLCVGWTPQSFTSSRKNRAEFKQQSMLNFLDEDEKEVSLHAFVCSF